MFNYLIGEVTEKAENFICLENNNIGYFINVSAYTLTNLSIGENYKIFTYLHVKEDDLVLYGFSSLEEKDIFLKLINISGVGPKMAITILSGLNLSDLVLCIFKGDINTLSKIKGLGKKTAERIVLELKDKFDVDSSVNISSEEIIDENIVSDVTDVLISLGVSKNEAFSLARKHSKPELKIEEIIQNVLKDMG